MQKPWERTRDEVAPGRLVDPVRVQSTVAALTGELAGVDRTVIERAVVRAFALYANARISDFVPVFVARDVRAHLGRPYQMCEPSVGGME